MSEKINAARQVEGGTGGGGGVADAESVEDIVAAMLNHTGHSGVSWQYQDNDAGRGQLVASTTAAFQYTLIFNAIDTVGPDYHPLTASLRRIYKAPEVASVQYSTDGGSNFLTVIFPATSDIWTGNIVLPAGTRLFWKIAFTGINTSGSLVIVGQ